MINAIYTSHVPTQQNSYVLGEIMSAHTHSLQIVQILPLGGSTNNNISVIRCRHSHDNTYL
jgi:hypothetical protein